MVGVLVADGLSGFCQEWSEILGDRDIAFSGSIWFKRNNFQPINSTLDFDSNKIKVVFQATKNLSYHCPLLLLLHSELYKFVPCCDSYPVVSRETIDMR
jgi:hypothetical protein